MADPWEFSAGGATVFGDGQQVRAEAEAHLQDRPAGTRVLVLEKRLALDADMEPCYEPTGRSVTGVRRDDGSVGWP